MRQPLTDLTATIPAQELLNQLVEAKLEIARLEQRIKVLDDRFYKADMDHYNTRTLLESHKKHRCIVGYTAVTRVKNDQPGPVNYIDGNVLYSCTLDDLQKNAEKAASDALALRTDKLSAKPVARPIYQQDYFAARLARHRNGTNA